MTKDCLMLINHLRIAFRSITRRTLYSSISIFGLATALAVCMLVTAFVSYERGFDSFYPDSDRIVRLNWIDSGTGARFATFQNPLSPLIAQSFPEVESFTRLYNREFTVGVNNESRYATVSLVDAGFFQMFPYEVIAGNPDTAIQDMNGAVLTEAGAEQLFGELDVIGNTFTLRNTVFRVRAVVANSPANSHLVANYFLNIENAPKLLNIPGFWEEQVRSAVMYHYLKIARGTSTDALATKIEDHIKTNIAAEYSYRVLLQPLSQIHFDVDLQREYPEVDEAAGIAKPHRQRSDLVIFTVAASLTLFIAVFNFMNLQIVQASRRAREIGIRRTVGATQSDVAVQFVIESVLICALAVLAAVSIYQYLVPIFSALVVVPAEAFTLSGPGWMTGLFVLPLILGFAAGAYPGSIIAGMAPVMALRGEVIKSLSSSRFRAALVMLQFSISSGMIISAGIISQQIDFAMSKPLGYDPSNVVILQMSNSMRRSYEPMRNELLEHPGIQHMAVASLVPTQDSNSGGFFARAGDPEGTQFPTRNVTADGVGYFDALGMQIVAGRALSFDNTGDQQLLVEAGGTDRRGGVMLNESAARSMGWENPIEAVGQSLTGSMPYGRYNATVVGVVADAQYRSLRSEIEPMAFLLNAPPFNMVIKIGPENTTESVELIQQVWQKYVPDIPIRMSFLEDSYAEFYAGESRTFGMLLGISILAIGISCLGLYALASYIVEKRTKEISIRKILGATVRAIIALLAWDFWKLIMLANLIAWPFAWWMMQNWLNNFAYQTDIGPSVFFMAGMVTAVVALGTVFQSAYRVASANPAEVLKAD